MTDPESPMLVENMLLMRKEDFDDLLDRAAERGARRTAWQTVIKVITTGILAALLVGAAIKLKLMGGGQ